jgi:exopolysaccharide biosynthesis polyprenyl glycosylphosphotransferase
LKEKRGDPMKGYFSFLMNRKRITFILLDFLLVILSILLAFLIRFGLVLNNISKMPLEKVVIYSLILLPQVFVLFYIMGMYERKGFVYFPKTILKLFIAVSVIGMLNGLIFYFYQTLFIGRVVFVLQLIIFLILSGLGKLFLIMRFRGKNGKNEVIMLNLSEAEKELLSSEQVITGNYEFFEFKFESAEDLLKFLSVTDKRTILVFSSDSELIDTNISRFINMKLSEYNVYDFKTFFINATGRIPCCSFGDVWTIISDLDFIMGIGSFYKIKRLVDILLSAVMILLLLPFFILISAIIKLTSRGPVFYVQERLGWNKKPFNVIKFRTMVADAEKGTGPRWAAANDPRITRIGKLLRFTRLDELPQLFNVLRGDMTFVGIRPIRKYFSDQFAQNIKHYDLRFFIKPGVTGWGQVNGSYAVPDGEKTLQYELFYLKNMSIIFDLVIFLKTLKTIFDFKGR